MSWATDLAKIRRLLRDPDGNIWSDAFLQNLYNDVQKDLQHKTLVLEAWKIQRVPGLYEFVYMHGWEYRYCPGRDAEFYQCLYEYSGYVVCYRWESQQITGIDASVSDYGVHFTQPWEAFMGQTPGELVRFRFPRNMRSLKYIAYDEEPIGALSQKSVQLRDASYITTSGDPIGYYLTDEVDKEYVLYPRPSRSFANEIEQPSTYSRYTIDENVLFDSDDTEDAALGMIAVRVGSDDTATTGIPVDIVDVTDNLFMVYDVDPADINSAWDEGDFPAFLRKYAVYGVVARAYGANTDGRIGSLADYWQLRYMMGVQNVKKYRGNIRQGRDYRLTIKGPDVGRTRRHPRLPSDYPAVNP